MYTTEQELVDIFLKESHYKEPWATFRFETEFNYCRGKTDIIAISPDNEVIALEAKLSKWRTALQQAYRNRCFADKSYVLLPFSTAQTTVCHEHEFRKRGGGICTIVDNRIVILQEAVADEPIQPWLRNVAIQYAAGG